MASVVERLRGWPYGPVRVVSTVQIGGEHGLSGTVYRLTVDGEDGQRRTLILKQDGAPGIERALAFHASVADRLSGSIPACYGGEIEVRTRIGILFLEDIAPALQGDVLVDPATKPYTRRCGRARVHAAPWRATAADHPSTLPR